MIEKGMILDGFETWHDQRVGKYISDWDGDKRLVRVHESFFDGDFREMPGIGWDMEAKISLTVGDVRGEPGKTDFTASLKYLDTKDLAGVVGLDCGSDGQNWNDILFNEVRLDEGFGVNVYSYVGRAWKEQGLVVAHGIQTPYETQGTPNLNHAGVWFLRERAAQE